MAENMTRTTPSGATITEADYQTIKKESTKETLKSVLALVGIGAVVLFVKGRMETKNIKIPTITTD